MNTVDIIKKKRGRKSKADANSVTVDANSVTVDANSVTVDANSVTVDANSVTVDANSVTVDANSITTETIEEAIIIDEKIPKKRGRKPKGGKIIQPIHRGEDIIAPEQNIILHLKCKSTDLLDPFFSTQNATTEVETYQFEQNNSDLGYFIISNNGNVEFEQEMGNDDSCASSKDLTKKLEQLAINLHTNNISDKKSSCFWCTHDFDNPPIFIPKYELKNSYHCYGCFCSPECAVAYLFKESIDSTARFERYHLINHIYCKIYNYDKNIKPAPDPHYTLNKFYGNLSIQEYRTLLKNERLLLVVDKTLTRILPELHDDNDDFVINNQSIPSSKNKFQLRKTPVMSKNDILNQKFNLK